VDSFGVVNEDFSWIYRDHGTYIFGQFGSWEQVLDPTIFLLASINRSSAFHEIRFLIIQSRDHLASVGPGILDSGEFHPIGSMVKEKTVTAMHRIKREGEKRVIRTVMILVMVGFRFT